MLFLKINIKILLTTIYTIFFIGLFGILINRKNIINILMSIELLFLSVNLNFITFSIYLDDSLGQIFVFFILTMAAAESAIGLSIISTIYKLKNSIQIDFIKKKQSKI